MGREFEIFLFKVISFIEITFRSAVVYEMFAITKDPFWYMEKWSRLLGSLKKRVQIRIIANRLGILPENLVSWIRSLATLRNLCAHHSIIWNKHIPNSPNGKVIEEQGWNRDLLGSRLFVILAFLNKYFSKREDFLFEINKIIEECPECNCRAMLGISPGFIAC